jgi:hypothetical protein
VMSIRIKMENRGPLIIRCGICLPEVDSGSL